MLNELYEQVANELNLDPMVVKAAYQSQWQFIRNTIEALPLKGEFNEKRFTALKTNFNLPSLGKLYTTGDKIKRAKRKLEFLKKLMVDDKA